MKISLQGDSYKISTLMGILKIACIYLWNNKLRSMLMLIAMCIAVSSFIISVAIGDAGEKKIHAELQSFGINSIWIYRDWQNHEKNYDFNSSSEEISNIDLKSLSKRKDLFNNITGMLFLWGKNIRYKNKSIPIGIIGTTPSFKEVNKKLLIRGRFLTEYDLITQKKVCVLSYNAYAALFNNHKAPAIGFPIFIGDEKFVVIGVLQKEDTAILNMIGSVKRNTLQIYVPLSIVQHWRKTSNIQHLQISAYSLKDSEKVAEIIKNILFIRHNKKYSFIYETLQNKINISNRVMGILAIVLGSVASISLLIGGLGIANIMVFSVTERFKEIGIKKAIGALPRDIILQILFEAMLIGMIGGIFGIISSTAIILMMQRVISITHVLSFPIIVVSFLVSILIGGVAGCYPALKASKIDPAKTLRRE